jgi:hypothetical protein
VPRKKFAVPSERVRFEGYQRMPITDPRDQVAWDWYEKNRAERRAFPIAWELIKAALNGELGEGVKAAVEHGNTEETISALQDLIGAFGE